jgi:type II secretory pathway pseudopilin PulG
VLLPLFGGGGAGRHLGLGEGTQREQQGLCHRGYRHVGILAAIAIPNFIKFQSRAKQSECKAQLRSIHTAALSYRAENNEFTADAQKLGVSFDNTRYAYALGEQSVKTPTSVQAKGPDAKQALAEVSRFTSIGVSGACPECELTVACVGNVDGDDELDIWSISTAMRSAPNGRSVSPGEVFNHFNDVSNDEEGMLSLAGQGAGQDDDAEPGVDDSDDTELDGDKVAALGLSEPTSRQLQKLEIYTIDDLMRMDPAKLKGPARNELTEKMKEERETEWPPPIHPRILDEAHVEKEPAMNACYEAALKKNADIGARVVLTFEVQPTGAVTNAKLEEDEVGDASFAKCVLRTTLGWRLPVKPKAVIDVRMPFVFEDRD